MHMPQVTALTLREQKNHELIWGIGLTDTEIRSFHSTGITELQIENRSVKDLTLPLPNHTEGPLLTIIPMRAWITLDTTERQKIIDHDEHKLVLLLDKKEPEDFLDIQEVISQNFLDAQPLPFTREKLEGSLAKAREMRTVYSDIFNMTNEIMLERELLSRKNDQLDFLNKILTKASKSLDPATIINQAGEELEILLDVESVMGIFWNNDAPAFLSADIFLGSNLPEQLQDPWIGYLLDQAERHARYAIKTYQVTPLKNAKPICEDTKTPDPACMIPLPLVWDDKTFGLLFIVSKEAELLGRDKVQILHSVANHLALALRNALLYRHAQDLADHDGLTRIFSRQNFENKLSKELKRHQRYQNELSLFMLDLDYFKRINDEYGHLAGDMVLREIGEILRSTLRECDFPARYGGEEFVVILPHTKEDQAWILAERIRSNIAAHKFRFQGRYFQITASIGISSIKPTMLQPDEYLVHLADQALYKAKTSGRNMVCKSADPHKEGLCDVAAK